MGSAQLQGMREMLSERLTLEWHLRYNHYPPLPSALIEACEQALEALREEDYEREIAMPSGIQFRGRDSATAEEIAESAHLWDMV